MFDSSEGRHNRNRTNLSLTALFAILLGLIFLLNNFGILPWEIWQNIWKFWPVLLILFGIEAILGRNSSFRSFGFLLFLIFVLPLILILNPLSGNPLATKKLSVEKPLGNLTKSQLFFNLASANIKIDALESSSSKVVQGSINYSSLLPKPEIKEESLFGQTKFSFTQPTKEIPFLNNIGNNVNLKISQLIPYDINIKSNTGNLNLNLTEIRIDFLNIETGAGKFSFELSAKYSSKVYIRASASLISFKIPNEAGVSFKTDSNLKQINLPDSRFERIGGIYKSKNYEISANKIDIEVSGPISSVEIKS